ncbi:MAG TPA: DUF4199 domain-containing protein [Terriglobia bacterium]|nr:DUF4199 domain-containing protein [Terriglobia bacterium]
MKKTIVTFGLISGAITSFMMIATLPFIDTIGFDRAEILGYTTIVLSFLLVYFGIRSYRDHVAGGTISFGRAFQVGILITLISCVCYVVTWEILYFSVLHGFMDRYAVYAVEQLKASGASPESVQAQLEQMKRFKELYENPFFNVAITFIEPFPIGLIMTLISAAILRRKPPSLLASAQVV